jgi:hypothetical protein
MMLRDWVEVNGWKDLDVRLLGRQKWASKAFTYSSSDPHYKQVLQKVWVSTQLILLHDLVSMLLGFL